MVAKQNWNYSKSITGPDIAVNVEHSYVHFPFCSVKFSHGMEGQQETPKKKESVNTRKTI